MNTYNNLTAIIMAAGKGTRMKSDLPKVMLTLNGRPLLSYVIETARSAGAGKIVVIVGHKRELLIEKFRSDDIDFVTQEPQLGTGHAVAQTEETLDGFYGDVLTLSGDVPLISADTINRVIKKHRDEGAMLTLLTSCLDDPGSYGRIIRADGKIIRNVEAKDADEAELMVGEINCGIYVFNKSFLFESLKQVDNNNAQGEYYLTDLINMAAENGFCVASVETDDPAEALGVNRPDDLKTLERRLASS